MTSVRFASLVAMLVAISSAVDIPRALAEEASPELSSSSAETIPEAIDRAASQSSFLSKGNFFEDRSTLGDAAFTFGLGYDEARLAKEARLLGTLFQDLLNQQTSDGPIIRTRDLANPYTTSVLTERP